MTVARSKIKALVVAGTQSGVGKTTITLALLAAFKRRGLKTAPFKVGPDFIDPGHHQGIVGRVSRNLDGWMLSERYNQKCFAQHTQEADVAIIEGVMGVFDGFSGSDESGSTAQMAKWLGAPILLVVNAASMARSAAALVQGFESFDPELSFVGVLFNNLGSEGHLNFLQEALHGHVHMPCIGGLLRNTAVKMPERHLGLVTAEDHPLTEAQIDGLADWLESRVDVELLFDQLPEIDIVADYGKFSSIDSQTAGVRIAVARDIAFCFYYQDNLDLLTAAGAQLVPFSPVNDAVLPDNISGIYLGGGYPELHARSLAQNSGLRNAICHCSRQGMPIYGECGGFMYLCQELTDPDGQVYPMTGCFPFQCRMQRHLRTLGYREISLTAPSILGPEGSVARGHEFHYSYLEDTSENQASIPSIYCVSSRNGQLMTSKGYCQKNTLGSYVHLHFGSNPQIAVAFVQKCKRFHGTQCTESQVGP